MSVPPDDLPPIAENGGPAVEIFQGFRPISTIIDTGGMNVDLDVTLEKTLLSYDWEMLYALYGVPPDAALDAWVTAHKAYPDQFLIERMFPFIRERSFHISCKVTIHVTGDQRVKLRLGARVIRLQSGGIRKDVPLLNSADIVAVTSDGTPYDRIDVADAG